MTPKWDGQRWRIRVMQEGKTYSFSCKEPGAKGRKEVIRKYEAWLYNEGSGEKSVAHTVVILILHLKNGSTER